MQGVAEARAVAKPKGRPKRSDRDDVAVKVGRTIVGKAKLVATHRGVSVAELLTDLLAAPVDRAYVAMVRELESEPKSARD